MEITRLRVDKSGAKYKISSHSFGARFELTSERANAAGWPTSIPQAFEIVVETESAPSRHTVTKNPERIRSFQRVTNEASRIFSGKEKRNTCRIRSYITRILNVRLNFIEEGKFQLICNPLLQRIIGT